MFLIPIYFILHVQLLLLGRFNGELTSWNGAPSTCRQPQSDNNPTCSSNMITSRPILQYSTQQLPATHTFNSDMIKTTGYTTMPLSREATPSSQISWDNICDDTDTNVTNETERENELADSKRYDETDDDSISYSPLTSQQTQELQPGAKNFTIENISAENELDIDFHVNKENKPPECFGGPTLPGLNSTNLYAEDTELQSFTKRKRYEDWIKDKQEFKFGRNYHGENETKPISSYCSKKSGGEVPKKSVCFNLGANQLSSSVSKIFMIK